jgi:uncharacterized protein with HEPN domain
MRDDFSRLQDILDSITLIEKTLSNGLQVYDLTEIEFQGILRCLELIGEASKSLSEEVKNKYPEIPWRAIGDMRNVLAHQYFEVDPEKIENVINDSLNTLKNSVLDAINRLN